jgi:hypothetical protein
MLHVWLIPALVVLVVAVILFYLVLKAAGGSGARTDGRTVVDKPMQEEDLPPE